MITQFENDSAFENAALMLEACRGAFERGGFHQEARSLRGLEASNPSIAYASLRAVLSVEAKNEETASAKKLAVIALQQVCTALTPSILPLAC